MSPSPDRTNGVTILFKGQVMVTQPPTPDDQKFLNQASYWFQGYKKEHPNG